ncbi:MULTISPECIES: glycosyltransferase family 4 protein [Sphingobacterium]|uniref:glycosyltransferase family 4 protein n=1 Tax=Sphingobacterium TaxID=28453 RepID=UPI00257B1467|nr:MULTISPECIES: glycosyltransferase family 4 protein [Sphingobacterium]
MSKIRLLQVVNDAFALPFFIGEQFGYFKERDVDQYVACPDSSFLRKYLGKMCIPYFVIPITRSFSPLGDAIAVWKLFKVIKKNHFTHVFGHTPKGAMIAMMAAYLAGVENRVYFRHGLVYETAKGPIRKILIAIEKLTCRLATTIVNVSPSVAARAETDGIKNKLKSILLSKGTCNGVNIDRFSRFNSVAAKEAQFIRQSLGINDEDFVVGFVGRMVRDKGIIDLIEAWQLVHAGDNKMKLVLIGPFEKRDAVPERILAQIGNLKSIIHIDFIEDVTPYYCLMDILVLPSYREGFPTVILEASSMSLPVLTSKATGCVDAIVEGETGLHITHDPKDIADKIKFYRNNLDVRKQHGINGRQFIITHFQQRVVWEDIADKLFFLKKTF